MEDITGFITEAKIAINAATDLAAIEQLRVKYLGKKGQLTASLKELGKLSPEERPKIGQIINQAKQELQALLEQKTTQLQQQQLDKKLASESIDVTLPGRGNLNGSIHPVNLARERIEMIFAALGFEIVEGPEIEDTYHNFTALNTPEHHPSRTPQDTFYFADGTLLRTQTSTVQIHYMKSHKPPLRMIAPGRVYRRDFDVTHTPMFHQVECLLIDKDVSLADLKSLVINFLRAFFDNQKLQVRFRPSYFPFTEPSAEADLQCVMCNGKGCRVCGESGWLEMGGCGMVHPNVLRAGDIDPEEYNGYAFGFGIDRLAMFFYEINDLRALFENNLKFLKQFN
ncbi:MAG: phenylalanine--tRNA ligase subunit alpha [Gammaproteobacteria bacterium]|jgi:phenylalanyl-tRNA synthetase alpha chain